MPLHKGKGKGSKDECKDEYRWLTLIHLIE